MIRSAISAFVVILVCFAILQTPATYESIPLPSATATPPASLLPLPDSDELWAAIGELEARVEKLEAKPAVAKTVAPAATVVATSCPDGVCPMPAAQSYTPRWHNTDGLSLRDHAVQAHGFDPRLSDAQLAAQHDAHHDKHGGAHPGVQRRPLAVQSLRTQNCPNGVCPTQSAGTVRRTGLFGWRTIIR